MEGCRLEPSDQITFDDLGPDFVKWATRQGRGAGSTEFLLAAFSRIEIYLSAAGRQIDRIKDYRMPDDLLGPISQHFELYNSGLLTQERMQNILTQMIIERRPLFMVHFQQLDIVRTDAHFYFTCWDTIYKILKKLKQSSGLACVKPILNKYKGEFERYRKARDHMEHFDERLPGGQRAHKDGPYPSVVSDTREAIEFVFAGEKWDISEHSLIILRTIVLELRRSVITEIRTC